MAGQAPVKKQVPKAKIKAAFDYEAAIAEEAAAVRAEAEAEGEPRMDRALFMRLWPLLRRPIPEGFLVEVSRGEGKPYDSKGVKSVDVQIARMDNVLGPLWWSYCQEYHDDGKLCEVTVAIHAHDGEEIVTRSSWGGMNRGSTQGNLYKGSFTNAAKLAFARIGPAHEVYVGGTDLEPDSDPETAKLQAKPAARANADSGGSHDAELAMLLATKDPRQKKRQEADDAMKAIGVSARQRLAELKSHDGSAQSLQEVITRAQAAADAMAAAGEQIGLPT